MRPAHVTFVFRLLLGLYFPFLALVCLAALGLLGELIALLEAHPGVWFLLVPLIALVGFNIFQVLRTLPVLKIRPPDGDWMELRLPRELLDGVSALVAEVARNQRLSAPQEIRVAADTIAHVYEDGEGWDILVIGGLAVATLTQEALAGVIAHELSHTAAGDTRLSRRGFKRVLVMSHLEARFRARPSANLNPLIWLLRLYHLLYRLAWAANSRNQEHAADRHFVALVGKESAAATLLHTTLPERLPYIRLSSIAQACLSTNEPIERIFTEQRDRARTIADFEWREALEKELREETSWFDSHPGLRDRLKAIGVTPKKALKLALKQTGPPARDLFPLWEAIEKELTERLMMMYRRQHLEKLEMAQIILGRPLGSR